MRISLLFFFLLTTLHFSCKDPNKTSPPVVVTMTEASARNCVYDTICAEIKLSYPVLSGGANPAATQAINDSLRAIVYMVIGGDPALPLPQAFDSACLNLYLMLEEQLDLLPDYPAGFTNELSSKILYRNTSLISVEMSNYSFTGGAHGNYSSAINSYFLETGKSVQLTDIVQDTTALLPMIEAAFVAAKNKEGSEQYTLEDLVFTECIPLPLPSQWCIEKAGLRLTYNPYEVAPYAVGQTNIVLSWEQLGDLAAPNKWIN